MIDIGNKILLMAGFMIIYVPLTLFKVHQYKSKILQQEAKRCVLEEKLDEMEFILEFSNRLHTVVREFNSKKSLELLLDVQEASHCYKGLEKKFYSNFNSDVILIFNTLVNKNSSGEKNVKFN